MPVFIRIDLRSYSPSVVVCRVATQERRPLGPGGRDVPNQIERRVADIRLVPEL
jgi:hypothetical protein